VSDYNETKAYGQDTSARPHRVPDRNRRFYTEHAVAQYNRAFRALAAANGFTIGQNARSSLWRNLAIIDSQIACWDSKYHYSFWRPSTAIRSRGGNASLSPIRPGSRLPPPRRTRVPGRPRLLDERHR